MTGWTGRAEINRYLKICRKLNRNELLTMRNWVSRQRCRCSVVHYMMANRHRGGCYMMDSWRMMRRVVGVMCLSQPLSEHRPRAATKAPPPSYHMHPPLERRGERTVVGAAPLHRRPLLHLGLRVRVELPRVVRRGSRAVRRGSRVARRVSRVACRVSCVVCRVSCAVPLPSEYQGTVQRKSE